MMIYGAFHRSYQSFNTTGRGGSGEQNELFFEGLKFSL